MPTAPIVLLGAFDSKGAEYAFLREAIHRLGGETLAVNFGVLGGADLFPVEVDATEIAAAGGGDLAALRSQSDRGAAMKCMAAGAPVVIRRLYDEGKLAGVIGMGGSGGASVITAAMRALPLGVPKVCVTTVAGGDVSPYVGAKDVTLIPSITDVAGLNRISRMVFTQAAGAIVGMVRAEAPTEANDRPIIAASMFGNTTACVDGCRHLLEAAGYEVLVFHATGVGGRTMETLIDDGFADACLDVTTTEWADQLCGGVFSAGEDRLSAPGRRKIPHLIAPGCIDMVNFGPPHTVPQALRDAGRLFYEWNPSVTLMRTSVEENRQLGQIFAAKANAADGPRAFILPLRGVSILDGDGQLFCDREADHAMFAALRANLRKDIPIVEVDANINDPVFVQRAADMMLQLIKSAALALAPGFDAAP
ncbi:MAG: Tm-1-like ATP-binding domain-containing protein [Pirellulales bacterium]|nr:Tm-1-like ATP-binding domain-containing protein [Pirellulales bacterium]